MAVEEAAQRVLASIKPALPGTSPFAAVTDDQLLIKNLEKALHILDKGGVTRVMAEPSGRTVFQVLSESKGQIEYMCFPEHFCSCPSFYFEVVSRGHQLCCKHQLAARLATSLQIFKETVVSDSHLALLLLHMLPWNEMEMEHLTKCIQDGGTEVVEAKAGAGSATLSMAYAAAKFADALLRTMRGEMDIMECAYIASAVTEQ